MGQAASPSIENRRTRGTDPADDRVMVGYDSQDLADVGVVVNNQQTCAWFFAQYRPQQDPSTFGSI